MTTASESRSDGCPAGGRAPERVRCPAVSVVIPALDERKCIAAILGDLRELDLPHEVIVADGGSTDGTPELAALLGARVVAAPRGRGVQLAAGVRQATAAVLCVLHADARLDAAARRELASIARTPTGGAFAFRLRIDGRGWRYRLIEFGANLRARVFRLPYGDQGLIVGRADYDAAGGYHPMPVMEDVALVDALRRVTNVRLLRSSIAVSARRWERDGPLTRSLRNWRLLIAWRLGASTNALAARYLPHSTIGSDERGQG
ncbi:MAG TPA: TIGR04283 family arsenosugar biosynthesis glycosyltransferase [Gemmatimonadaceae bacterium]|nr:TIGR04283 family arsenosugar biosynthesis glycosyltransferase [Gemmatimonadaceae bacterium]